MKKNWIVEIQEQDGEYYLPLSDEMLEGTNIEIGDTVVWRDLGNGSWSLRKKEPETELVLVECISTFRQRYLVEVPKGKPEYALDTVTMEEAKEFSQQHLGETIVSHRVVNQEEALKMCNEENDYCSSWTDEHKMDVFFTKMKE